MTKILSSLNHDIISINNETEDVSISKLSLSDTSKIIFRDSSTTLDDELNKKSDKPDNDDIFGNLIMSLGDGKSQWVDIQSPLIFDASIGVLKVDSYTKAESDSLFQPIGSSMNYEENTISNALNLLNTSKATLEQVELMEFVIAKALTDLNEKIVYINQIST